MPFPANVKSTPIFGLGCVAGAAGIARASDYSRAYPKEFALLLSVELCSLNWQDDDQSIANLISTGLFGDGCAAVVLAGAEAEIPTPLPATPKLLATRRTFYRNTEYMMGWDIRDTGFRIVLSADVPKVVLENLRGDVDAIPPRELVDPRRHRPHRSLCILEDTIKNHPGQPGSYSILAAMARAFCR
jgi:alkylresorcinol/alkylpyrone synthase